MRFSSEYGFQSLPSIYSITAASQSNKDLSVNSKFLQHRQHLPSGYVFMRGLVKKNLALTQSNDTVRDLMDYIYLSQINQAVSVKVQTVSYRQAMSSLNAVGEGLTMGALYWQLNDVWDAPSWSSIEFDGRWKMLHYYAAEFFAPVIVTSKTSLADEVTIFIVSDKLERIEDVFILIKVFKWDSMVPISTESIENLTIVSYFFF